MKGSLSRVVLIKFQWLLNKGFIKNVYAGLAFSDTVGSTVAPVLGKSRCRNPEIYATVSEMQYIKKTVQLITNVCCATKFKRKPNKQKTKKQKNRQ